MLTKFLNRPSWRLFRSTVAESVPYIGLTFLSLTTLVFIQQLGRYSQIVLSFEASTEVTVAFLFSILPGIIVVTLPVSLVLGTIITCSRQSADSELTAARACGIDPRWLGLPFLVLGMAGTLASLYLTADVAPTSLRRLKSLRSQILLQEATLRIKPHTFITTFPGVLLFVQDVDDRTGEWLGVFILQQDAGATQTRVVTAERGRLRISSDTRYSVEAELFNGVSSETDGSATSSKISVTRPQQVSPTEVVSASDFQKASIRLIDRGFDNGSDQALPESAGMLAEMTLAQLRQQSQTAPGQVDRLKAKVEWHRRLALPFASLLLTCLAFTLSLRGRRLSTRPRKVIAILFIALGYYLLLIAGQNVAASGYIPAWLAVWLPNIVAAGYLITSLFGNQRSGFQPLRQHLRSAGFVLSDLAARLFQEKLPAERGVRRQLLRLRSIHYSPINLINYLIISEILKYFVLAVVALVITLITFTLFDLIPALSKSSVSFGYGVSYLVYLTPQFIYHVSPFAIMIAILAGGSILARTNQIVVLSAAGLDRFRVVGAIIASTILVGSGLLILADKLLPTTNREQDLRYHRIKNKQLEQTTIAFGRKWVFGRNKTIYGYQRIDLDNSLFQGAVYRLSAEKQLLEKSIIFNQAVQTGPTEWKITRGLSEDIGPDLIINRRSIGPDTSGDLRMTIEDGPDIFRRTVNQSTKLSSTALREYITQLREMGIDSTEMVLDYQKRLALPFSCLTLGIIAIPFATTRRARRSSPALSISIGVVISLILWLLMSIFESAGRQNSLPINVAVWGPQILFLAVGVFINARDTKM